ncbi:MAG: winged helix-turn-helix transcriptional regulator [Flavobacteriales bacterium]|nr:winged helix-turn-helix transcriptional regulator [Flavobacteriales bacterium]
MKMESTCIRALADTKQIERCKTLLNKMSPELSLLAAIVNLTGNETRLKILYLLQLEKRLCVCDMSDIQQMTVPAISQQLRKLKDGGVIESNREGTVIYYFIADKHKKLISEILGYSNTKAKIKDEIK